MDLKELRKEIDEIDSQLVKLYEDRMDVSSRIADFKISTGKKVFDREREIEKINEVKSLAHSDFNRIGVEELFSQIMSMSRKLQYQKLQEEGASLRLPFIPIKSLEKEKARLSIPEARRPADSTGAEDIPSE